MSTSIGVIETQQQRIHTLSHFVLPNALDAMSKRHDSLLKIIQYLEGNYLLAVHNKADRTAIDKQAKWYLNDALTRIASDIDTTAANLEQYISLGLNSVVSLSQLVASIQSYMSVAKTKAAKKRLNNFIAGLSGTDLCTVMADKDDAMTSKMTFSDSTACCRVIKMKRNNRRMSLPSYTHTNVKRISLNERLSRLDLIGTTLNTDFHDEDETMRRGPSNVEQTQAMRLGDISPIPLSGSDSKSRHKLFTTQSLSLHQSSSGSINSKSKLNASKRG